MTTTPVAHPLEPDRWPALLRTVDEAFLADSDPTDGRRTLEVFEPGRVLGLLDGDALVGGGATLSKRLTVPGGRRVPMAGVSYVGVRPDTRGRGGLTELMRAQLHGLHADAGEPVAGLTASMAAIYGRFGYGAASRAATLTVPGRAPLRPGAPVGGTVRWVDEPAARPHLRRVHEAAADRPGWLARPEASWRWWLDDSERMRGGDSAYRYALHHPDPAGDRAAPDGAQPDGYAVFRINREWTPRHPGYQLRVAELVALTPEAHAGLWRSLTSVDFVTEVRQRLVPLDDPLPLLLANPRAALSDVADNLWLRLVDLDRALPLRGYAAECAVTLEVTDRFCPWNAGRWRLAADPERAEVARTSIAADLSCDVADLAEAFLGGTRITALAAAGRVREHRPGTALALSRALAADRDPLCPEIF